MTDKFKIENFDYDRFKVVVNKVCNDWLHKCEQVAGEILVSVGERLCILEISGYGFLSQREMISLKIENAMLKKESISTIQALEEQLKEINRKIKEFLIEYENTTLD